MSNVLSKQLQNFGLSEKEAKIYIALVELEIATANQAAERAGVNRSSTYVVLDSLMSKGLVSVSEDKTVKQYVATNPEVLLQEIEETIQKQKSVKEGIENILPELKALHRETKSKPKVRVFTGKKGLIATFEDSLNSKEKVIRIASSVTEISKILPLYMPKYIDKRHEKGIKMIGIHPDGKIGRFLMGLKASKSANDDAVLIPKETFTFTSDYAIYDNKIAYMNGKDGGTAVIIEDKEIAQMSKNIFDLAHKEAKRIRGAKNS